jgi:MSHA biogenesis protein MshL
MNINHRLRHSVLSHLACIAGIGLLTVGSYCASAAQKREPVFSEIPGVTSPGTPADVTNPPAVTSAPAVPVPRPVPAPVVIQANPPPPIELQTTNKMVFAFQATDLDLRAALATFAKANNLNIVPDNDVTGTVTLDVRDLPLTAMMSALLDASDCTWTEQNGLIRVHATETKIFSIDYLRLSRKGIGQNSATLGSGSSGGAGGGAGGGGGGGLGGGGGGGGLGAGGMGGGGGSSSGGGNTISTGSSSINVTANNPVDFWTELAEELKFMLTPSGQTSLSLNKTAGIIQVTDRPSALRRVENYLTGVRDSVHRQVDIEARLYDVTLNDQFQFGIDWVHVAEAYGGKLGFGGATLPVANGGAQLLDSSIGGINHIGAVGTAATPGGNLSSLVFQNFNTSAAVNALAQQGTVEVISTPRLRTMNNQTALIKVGEEVPFFNTSTTIVPGTTAGTSSVLQQTMVNSITIGTILSITPQVSADDWISLDISPVLTSLKSIISVASSGGTGGSTSGGSGNSGATAPDLDTKQASTIVRVRDGNTVVLGGLIQTQKAKNDTKIPVLGDIPLIGKLFTGTFRFNQKKELVIFVTPHIIREGGERPLPTVSVY